MADERAESPEPILKFRKRPEEEEEEKVETPAQKEKGGAGPAPDGKSPFHWEITLTPALLTTDAGIVDLTSRLQKLLDEIIREMLQDRGTPIKHPVVGNYLNMYAACDQIQQIYRPQQVQMSPQQIEALRRSMGKGLPS